MPHDLYVSFIQHTRDLVRSTGKRPVGWQESARAGLTVFDFGDLTFLLLPRLPGVAHQAWSEPDAGAWAGHRDRLARHGRLWAQDDLTYFRTSTMNWL
jgi:N-acetyl-beta-hexosaminidase